MHWLNWLEHTAPSVWLREAPTVFGFPIVLFFHTLGLGIVAGLSVALCVWVLKFATRHSAESLEPFFGVLWLGFTIALLSGAALLLAYPTKALTDPVFFAKMGAIVIALVAMQWLRRRVFRAAGSGAPFVLDTRVRLVAGTSIVLWFVAVLLGRFLAYTYRHLLAVDALGGF